jgi:UDPglucose 6-dehydrogenase
MDISIIGTGYVGLSTGVGFAVKGNSVICVDVIKEKVEKINKGISPIYEPFLSEYLKRVLKEGKLKATTDLRGAIERTEVSFISVGTPSKTNGSIDLGFVEEVSKQIGKVLGKKNEYHVIVVKSTVVPGTTERIVIPNIEKYSGKRVGEFGVCMNPEFLREGKALEDFLKPDRIVIGEYDRKSGNVLKKLYKNFNSPVLVTNLKTAEMIKYASNAFLAAKVSLTNEIGNICKLLGIDMYDVAKGVGLDTRIGKEFLRAGAGFGGSCFPKDVKALIAKGKELGYDPKLLEEVLSLNERQKYRMVELLEKRLGNLKGKTIALLGLAFKPDSDDIREASSIRIISSLRKRGAKVRAYDPKAMDNMRKLFPDIEYCKDVEHTLKGSDACLIVTEWEEFKCLKDKDFEGMRNKIIIEGRKVLDPSKVKDFEGICW